MVLTCRRGIFHRTLKAVQLIVSSWMSSGGLRRSGLYKHTERHQQNRRYTVQEGKQDRFISYDALLNERQLMLNLHDSL